MALATVTPRDVDRAEATPSAWREVGIIAALYVGYSAARTLADGRLAPALARAAHIAHVEQLLRLPSEAWLNRLATVHGWLGLAADFWYASAHYLVTAAVLVWLYRRGRDVYVPARRTLALASLVALVFYLLAPTAPPRMLPGFTDVMALHSDIGWWGSNASAPKGLGGMTNELAAFPSMHAGWALWVTLALWSATRSWWARGAGVVYALTTGVVVIATANHWVVDVIVGQAIMLAVWWGVAGHRARRTPLLRVVGSREPAGEAEAA